jgi:hypothetical protein
MNNDWRSRNTMTGRDALKAAAAILGLLFACILLAWIATKLLRSKETPSPPRSDPPKATASRANTRAALSDRAY